MHEIFGYISALCFSLCYLPQLWKTWRTKQVADISVLMWIIQGMAYSSGLVYGWYLSSIPLVLNYSLGLVYTSIWLCMWYKYKNKIESTRIGFK